MFCSFFKESETYTTRITKVFEKCLSAKSKSILSEFITKFNKNLKLNNKYISTKDKDTIKSVWLQCAINIDNLTTKVNIIKWVSKYCYKFKIKGFIHGVISYNNTNYNLSLSFSDLELLNDNLKFYAINNMFYNKANGINNSLLVMSVPHNVFYMIPYKSEDYTIHRGFATLSKNSKLRLRGKHCKLCSINNCKPLFLNGLQRLDFKLTQDTKMIELVTAGGKKIGELSDEVGQSDALVIDGKKIDLADVYSSDDLTHKFNTQAKELTDDTVSNKNTTGTSE